MICKKCGADIGNKGKCEYCNTVYFEEIQRPKARLGKKIWTKLKNRQKGIFGKIWTKLTFPTKVAMVLWFICCMLILPEIASMGFFQYVLVVIFGFLIYGGITQLISSKRKRRHMPNHSEQPIRPLTRNAGLSPKPYDNMDIPEFESFCCDILEQNGFTGISITKTPEDQGIDIIAFKNGAKYGIQCKCGASNIETATVQKNPCRKKLFWM